MATGSRPARLTPEEIVLSAAAATTLAELFAARMAAIRSGRLTSVPRIPTAGAHLLGGDHRDPRARHTLAARIGSITHRHPGQDGDLW